MAKTHANKLPAPLVLVLQHPELSSHPLQFLGDLAPREPKFSFAGSVLRLNLQLHEGLNDHAQHYCLTHKIDHAILPDYALSDLGAIISDMDSTLIEIECIDEIADLANIKHEVAQITEQSMRGKLDFAASLKRRVALLKGLNVAALQEVYDKKLTLTPGAQDIVATCKKFGIDVVLVSGGFTFFTQKLQEKLQLSANFANDLEVQNGRLTGYLQGEMIDANKKRDILNAWRKQLPAGKIVVAMGDGANDIPMIEAADVGVAFRAKEKVKQSADVAVNFGDLTSVIKLFRAE